MLKLARTHILSVALSLALVTATAGGVQTPLGVSNPAPTAKRNGGAAASAAASTSNAAIARVMAGLKPAITVKGAAPVVFALADRLAHYKVPGVSIAVVDHGRIVWARGIGVKEAGTSDPVTATTLFQAASISKPVTATAMLRLVAAGKLALDTPVNEYLKSWKLPDNALTANEAVTLRRIVSHSAGLTVHGFPGYAVTDAIPTIPQILDGAAPANTAAVRVDAVPGSLSRYSGGGTTIEQLLMTDVTGEAFPVLMRQLVLEPSGMTDSGYEQPLPLAKRGREAAGHRADGSMIPGRWHVYPEMAAAGLWTTPTDLLKWAMQISAARAGRATSLLPQALATQMLTAHKGSFGLGPQVHGSGEGLYFEHGGANEGFRCQVMYFPESGQGAAVMTNGDSGSGLANEILYALAAEYHWSGFAPRLIEPLAVDAATLEHYAGSYLLAAPDGGAQALRITVTRVAERIFAEAPPFMPRTDLLLLTPDKAVALESGLELGFGTAADGTIDRLELAGMTLRREPR